MKDDKFGGLEKIILNDELGLYGDIIENLNLQSKKEIELMKKTFPKQTDFRDWDYFLSQFGIKSTSVCFGGPLSCYISFKNFASSPHRRNAWIVFVKWGFCFLQPTRKITTEDKMDLVDYFED